MYIKLVDGVPERYTLRQLRKDNSNVSFPAEPTEELLASWDVYPFAKVEKPAYDPATEVCEQQGYVVVGGVWTQTWVVTNATAEEVEQRTNNLAASARSRRDDLLQETDWIAIKSYEYSENIPAGWGLYRQALRDITAQAGFPNDVVWPVTPT